MDSFTLITGLASLFGFLIQIFDLFPRLGQAREKLFLVLVGIFIGSLFKAIDPTAIRISFQITGFTLLVAVFVLVITGFLITAAFTADNKKREEFYNVAFSGFMACIFVLFFGGMLTGAIDSHSEKQLLSISELNTLVERSVQSKDYDRALIHLKTIKDKMPPYDNRTTLVDDRIREIEIMELK